MKVYLDNAATTAIAPEVIEVMHRVMQEYNGNPSSTHHAGREARGIIETARRTIAHALNAEMTEIYFTSGGTESSNMALKCAVRDLGVERIISSPMEHHCVLHTLDRLEKDRATQIEFIDLDTKGRVNYEHLESLLKSSNKKTLVSLMHANNEIGTLLDLERVAHLCQQYNAYFHSDTVQTVGHLPIDVRAIPIHFLTAGAHKFHGPKGVGFIYINQSAPLQPFVDGGSQEKKMRGGTENIYGIAGMAKALEMSVANMDKWQAQIEAVRGYLKEQLLTHFEDIQFNGDFEGNYLYTILSVSFPPSPKSDMLNFYLDLKNISISGGSACTAGSGKRSHVLEAIQAAPNRKTVRFSFCHQNTKAEIDFLIEQLKTLAPLKSTT